MTVFNDNALGSLEFTVHWEKDGRSHEECFLGRRFNPVNDIFPRGMREALEGKRVGESVTITYEPRMCIPRHRESLVRTLPLHRLRPKTVQGKPIIPCVGRFYPQGHINGITDVYPDTLTPFRLTELTKTTFTADCNHPLARIPITITATIQHLEPRDVGTYGSLTHWREKTCDWGPGMQAMLDGAPPDFFLPFFFARLDATTEPFRPPRLDAAARANIDRTFGRFLADDMRILSPTVSAPVRPEGQYDALTCVCFMEYQTEPVAFLRYMLPHLAPGAPVLVAFSHSHDERRVIEGWTKLHEFERMGLVLEYLRQAGLDTGAGTVSIRNDWRDTGDPVFLEKKGVSDPVYVVYGHKPEE